MLEAIWETQGEEVAFVRRAQETWQSEFLAQEEGDAFRALENGWLHQLDANAILNIRSSKEKTQVPVLATQNQNLVEAVKCEFWIVWLHFLINY